MVLRCSAYQADRKHNLSILSVYSYTVFFVYLLQNKADNFLLVMYTILVIICLTCRMDYVPNTVFCTSCTCTPWRLPCVIAKQHGLSDAPSGNSVFCSLSFFCYFSLFSCATRIGFIRQTFVDARCDLFFH